MKVVEDRRCSPKRSRLIEYTAPNINCLGVHVATKRGAAAKEQSASDDLVMKAVVACVVLTRTDMPMVMSIATRLRIDILISDTGGTIYPHESTRRVPASRRD